MTKLICLCCLLLPVASLLSQNLLPSEWKFRTGDESAWSSMQYDDSEWKTIRAGELWESQGYPGYDGYAWYRASAVIPSSLKSKAQKYGGFILRLNKVDDVDQLFLNGQSIGQTGQFPPDYLGMYDALREYQIPIEKINWDEPNLIAVRVYDSSGGGGIYGGAPVLTVKGITDLFSLKLLMQPENHILLNPKKISIPVNIVNNSDESLTGQLILEIHDDFKQPISVQTLQVKSGRQSSKTNTFDMNPLVPGFYKGSIRFNSEVINQTHQFVFGVDPEKIVSPTDAPTDFADYWARAKKELAAVAPQFKLTRIDSLCTPARDYFLLEMRSLGNVLVRGWYSRPVKAGKYPAILHVQGYSSYMQPIWTYSGDDMVSLGLNIRGHGNSTDNVNPGFPGFLLSQLHDSENYIYRGAYMDCIRAVDFLVSRPEVDATRIAVEGGSQGGALSFATAALDNERIAACAPAVPFLSDFRDYFKTAVWPGSEYYGYVEAHPEIGWESVYHTLSYIDIKNLAPWIKAPVHMSIGLLDETCPPHINFAAYNQLNVPKSYTAYPYAGHGLPGSNWQAKMTWIKKQFGLE